MRVLCFASLGRVLRRVQTTLHGEAVACFLGLLQLHAGRRHRGRQDFVHARRHQSGAAEAGPDPGDTSTHRRARRGAALRLAVVRPGARHLRVNLLRSPPRITVCAAILAVSDFSAPTIVLRRSDPGNGSIEQRGWWGRGVESTVRFAWNLRVWRAGMGVLPLTCPPRFSPLSRG